MTAAETNTKTDTETETEIDASILEIVITYVKHERRAQSQYWPMVEKALELYEKGMEQAQIARLFRLTFAKAMKLEINTYDKDPEYVAFRSITIKVVNIAKPGREWYNKLRKDKVGFYRMYELCTKVNEEAEPEVKPKTSNKKGNPKPTEPKAEAEDNEPEEAEAETEGLATEAWFAKCYAIVKHEPESFISMIAHLVENDELPEVILEPISQYLREK